MAIRRTLMVAGLALFGALPGCLIGCAATAKVEALAETNAALVQRVEKLEADQNAKTEGWFSPIVQLGGIGGYGAAMVAILAAVLIRAALIRVMTGVEDAPTEAKEFIKGRVRSQGGIVEAVLRRTAKRFRPK